MWTHGYVYIITHTVKLLIMFKQLFMDRGYVLDAQISCKCNEITYKSSNNVCIYIIY